MDTLTRSNEESSDAELVQAAKNGDREAFDALTHRHFGMVYGIAWARIGHRESAEDVAQEVFLRAYLHLHSLDDCDRFAGWLSRIARNLALNWSRADRNASRLATLVPFDETSLPPEPHSEKGARDIVQIHEQDQAIQEALFALPPDQREMVVLFYMEGLKKNEIAERLEVHPSTVGRQIDRALSTLKRSLDPILRESIPRLRPSREAAARTVALVAAASALSESARASFTAAGGGLSWTASVGASAGASETSTKSNGLFAFLQSIARLFSAAGNAGGAGKGIAIVVFAGLLVAAGALYMQRLSAQGRSRAAIATSSATPRDRGPILTGPHAHEVFQVFLRYQQACREEDFDACLSVRDMAREADSRGIDFDAFLQQERDRLRSKPEILNLIAAARPYSVSEYAGNRYKSGKQPVMLVQADDFEWFFQRVGDRWALIDEEFLHNAAVLNALVEQKRTRDPNATVRLPNTIPTAADRNQAYAAFLAYQNACRRGDQEGVLALFDFQSLPALATPSMNETQIQGMARTIVASFTPSLMATVGEARPRSAAVGLELADKLKGPVVLIRGYDGWAWFFHKTPDGWKLIRQETRGEGW